jgi:putative nucleotidyltransferase with HDIG domain
MTSALRDIVANVGELAVLPATMVRLLSLLDDLTVDAERVLDVVGTDPSLTSNLLKLSNSAYYGTRRRIGSVKEALVLLGNRTVVTMAMAAGMGDVLRGQLSAYRMAKDQMWRHALAMALSSSRLALARGLSHQEERAFTAGLVHDIGKLLLNQPLLRQHGELPGALEGEELLAAERAVLGCDHCEAGALLAETWSFPPLLVEAIAGHHGGAAAGDLAGVVVLAERLCRALGLGSHPGEPCSREDLDAVADGAAPRQVLDALYTDLGADVDKLMNGKGRPL